MKALIRIPLICAAVGLLPVATVAGSGDDLAREILRANRDFRSSLISVKVDFIQRAVKPEHWPSPFPDCRFTWAKSGKREVLMNDPGYDYAAEGGARIWCGMSKSGGLNLSYFSFDTSLVAHATYYERIPDLVRELVTPALAFGWRLRGFYAADLQGRDLISLMEQADPTEIVRENAHLPFDGSEDRDFPCVRWSLLRLTPRDSIEHELVFWFDESHSWLPRLWLVRPVDRKDPLGRLYGIGVVDFIMVDDALLDAPRPFPKTLVEYGVLSKITEIASVTCNKDLPGSLFEPEITPGARVVHFPGSRKQIVSYAGGENGKSLADELNVREREFRHPGSSVQHPPAAAANAVSVDATPHQTEWLSGTVLVIGCLLVVLAAVLRFRRVSV